MNERIIYRRLGAINSKLAKRLMEREREKEKRKKRERGKVMKYKEAIQ